MMRTENIASVWPAVAMWVMVILNGPMRTETAVHGGSDTHIPITNQRGRPLPSLTASLKVRNNNILLSDTNFIDHLAHFVRERIPERVVHAKGAGAMGYFEVTHDIIMYTKAAPFSEIGKRTPVLVRFSTVGGELGSADTAHDPRGFALKFYTEKGIWNMVGNNLPIFMIRDPMLFPSMVHSRKRHPQSHLADGNTFWDFTGLRPETTFHTLMLFSDFGYPASYRHMHGASVHAFQLVNEEGQVTFCKFHWLSEQGVKNMSRTMASQIAGSDPDYLTRDLFKNIEAGNAPAWRMYVQIMTVEEANNYQWNPFDITKLWREEDFPLIPVGRLVLNQNPTDYFSQVEMAAFCPGDLIPGIEMSPDPMLQGRSFSYSDAQRYRLGSNYQQLPINRPFNINPNEMYSFQRDGQGILDNGGGGPNYFPNSYNSPNGNPKMSRERKESVYATAGIVDRTDDGNDDNFSQPKLYLQSLTSGERSRLVQNLAAGMKSVTEKIRERALKNFELVDPTFAREIRNNMQKFNSLSK